MSTNRRKSIDDLGFCELIECLIALLEPIDWETLARLFPEEQIAENPEAE